ncbi:ABC transporter ATP-binding protein [Kineosporia babensis]|uniref:ABC transporter ATP-binding protein/permease n=1 Tax=Kineosporia babensis TaxID=499548 RepID=A0A9X1NEZ7_9ACTN|nr:ABC transporter ATP-binding protein/permease [Kineosporia babensis]
MDTTTVKPEPAASGPSSDETPPQTVLPELRAAWWETGATRRAEAKITGILAELPYLTGHAVAVAWRADRLRTLLVGGATVAGGVMSTFGLLSTQQVLVELFGSGPTPDRVRAAAPALLMLALIATVRGVLAIVVGHAQSGLAPRVRQSTQREFFEATSAVRLEAFDAEAFSDDMERASHGGPNMNAMVRSTADALAGLVNLTAVAVAVLVINPLLLLALLVATLPPAYAALRSGNLEFSSWLASSVRNRRLWILRSQLADRNSAPELRSYGLRRFLLGQYDMVMTAQTAEELRLARRVTLTTAFGAALGGLALVGVWVLLGTLLLSGRIPLSAAVTCVVAVQAAQNALSTLTYQLEGIFESGHFVREHLGFLERAKDYSPATAERPDRLPTGPLSRLEVRDATLLYPDRESAAVDHVSLSITAGQTVALVGENGSGKSTLAAMIAGLRSPTAGVLCWNQTPYEQLDQSALTARICVVLQEHHKWPYTAATNIAMGDIETEPSRPRIEQAARRATAHETINELPKGYQTLLDRTFKEGQDLSGGQWQRITAARGFYRDADLLIMDEPSSALDPRAEDALFQDLRARQGVGTTILITHRLANVRHADQIYVMHEGALVESGTHDELLRVPGRYADLFTLQAAGYQG